MTFCGHCGKQVAEQAAFCLSCGCKPETGARFCRNCGSETNPAAQICVKCGVPLATAIPEGAKSRLAAGLLGIFLGAFGVHRFYLGYTGIGLAQLFVTIFTLPFCFCFPIPAGLVWGLIEGILILTQSGITSDAQGRPLKD